MRAFPRPWYAISCIMWLIHRVRRHLLVSFSMCLIHLSLLSYFLHRAMAALPRRPKTLWVPMSCMTFSCIRFFVMAFHRQRLTDLHGMHLVIATMPPQLCSGSRPSIDASFLNSSSGVVCLMDLKLVRWRYPREVICACRPTRQLRFGQLKPRSWGSELIHQPVKPKREGIRFFSHKAVIFCRSGYHCLRWYKRMVDSMSAPVDVMRLIGA